MITQELELYLMDKKITPSVNLVQADTGRKIKLSFPDYKIPLGATAEIWAIKPSGKIVFNEAEVSDNTVLVKVTNQMIAEKGITIAQIKFKNAAEMISSFSFNIRCSEDISGNGVESENEITALDKFLEEQKEKLDDAIAEKTAQITENTNNISQNTNDINTLKENKIEKNQGDSNKGKFLKVGEDGNVVPEVVPIPDVSGQISKHNESDISHKDIRKDISTLKEDITTLDNTKADAIIETASGENIKTEISSDSKLVGLNVYGKSEQVVTKGYQLFDASKLPTKSQGGVTVTNNGDGSFTVSGSGTVDEKGFNNRVFFDDISFLKKGMLKISGTTETLPNFSVVGYNTHQDSDRLFIINNVKKEVEITEDILKNIKGMFISNFANPGSTIVPGTIKPMLYQDGDGTWEPFTNGKPAPAHDNESPIVNVGDKGYIALDITGENVEPQKLTLETPNGLPGIKVESGGNYTDSNGQQWVTDELDLARGKYIQRIGSYTYTKNDNWRILSNNRFVCTKLPNVYFHNNDRLPPLATIMCDSFKQSNLVNGEDYIICVNWNGHTVVSQKNITTLYDETTFKEFMNGKKVFYQIDAQIERDLSAEEINAFKKLTLNSGTNMISNDENAEMELTYTVDTRAFVENQISKLKIQLNNMASIMVGN